MWVIKNITTGKFFAGWHNGQATTTDSKIYASHFSSWDTTAVELKSLIGSWVALPKDEA